MTKTRDDLAFGLFPTLISSSRLLALSLSESRPAVQGIFAIRFLVGGFSARAHHSHADWTSLVLGQLAWFFATWFTYLLNGITDLAGDRQNGSTRPLASGRLDARRASYLCSALALGGLAMAAAVRPAFFAFEMAILVLGTAYSMGPLATKRWPVTSSMTVGLAGFLTYLAGAVASHSDLTVEKVFYISILAGWMVVAGNSKDFRDTVGDKLSGRKSLPIVLGPKLAAVFISAGCILIASVAASAAVAFSLWPLMLLFPAAAIMCWFWLRSPVASDRFTRQPYSVFMTSQYVVNGAIMVTWMIGV